MVTHWCVFGRCDVVAFSHSCGRGLSDIGGQGVAKRGVVLGAAGAVSVESIPEPGAGRVRGTHSRPRARETDVVG